MTNAADYSAEADADATRAAQMLGCVLLALFGLAAAIAGAAAAVLLLT